ncbi:MAG: hypothetical protein ACK5LK_05835 [Chthoniobacterales bacterium]
MGNILLVLAIIASLVTAGVGYMNHGKLTATKADLADTQSSLEQTTASLKKTEGDLKTSQDSLASLTTEHEKTTKELSDAKTEIDNKTSELAQAKEEVTKQTDEVKRLTAEVDAKDQQIANLSQNNGNTGAAEAGGDSGPSEELKAQLAEKDTLIEQLRAQAAAEATELAELREREQARNEKRVRQGLEGKILAINPAWNFVVLNVGDRNGVVNNAELLIKRSGNLIGKVRITSVEPSTAIADIVANSVPSGVSIEPGDQVIYAAEQ